MHHQTIGLMGYNGLSGKSKADNLYCGSKQSRSLQNRYYNTPLVQWMPHTGVLTWKPSQGTKLYCLVNTEQRHIGVNNLPKVVARQRSESSTLTTTPPSHRMNGQRLGIRYHITRVTRHFLVIPCDLDSTANKGMECSFVPRSLVKQLQIYYVSGTGRCCCMRTHQVAALFCVKWHHSRHIKSITSDGRYDSVNRCIFT